MLRLLYLSRGRIIKELSIGERGVREHIKKKSYQKKIQLWLISFMGSWTWLSKPLIIRQRVGLAYQRHWWWSFFRNLIDNQVIISFTKRFLTNQRSHTKTTRESNSKKFNQICFLTCFWIFDTSENQAKLLDSDNQINISTLMFPWLVWTELAENLTSTSWLRAKPRTV